MADGQDSSFCKTVLVGLHVVPEIDFRDERNRETGKLKKKKKLVFSEPLRIKIRRRNCVFVRRGGVTGKQFH